MIQLIPVLLFLLPSLVASSFPKGDRSTLKFLEKLGSQHSVDFNALSMATPYPTNPVYASIMVHNTTSCSSPINTYEMLLANTCLSEGKNASTIFYCAGGTVTRYCYNDGLCATTPYLCDILTSTCTNGAQLYACTSNPQAYGTDSPVVQFGTYNADSCSELLYASAFLNNYCYFHGGDESYTYEWPNIDIYSSQDCSSASSITTRIQENCTISTSDDDTSLSLGQPLYYSIALVTVPPTTAPTMAPTGGIPVYPTNPLFASIMYHNTTCSSPVFAYEVILANTCLITGESSVVYSCVAGGSSVTISYYENPSCSGEADVEVLTNVCSDDDFDDSYGAQFYSCTSNSNGYGTSSSLVAMETFDTNICTELIDGIAVLNNYCYYVGGSGSYKFSYPYFYDYSSNDCSGKPVFSYSLADEPSCFALSTIFDDDYSYSLGSPLYSSISEVNSGPASPTTKPTFAPSAVVVSDLIFTSNITMDGITSTNLDSASQLAIINTTAWAMNVPMSYVSYVSAFVPATGRRLIAEEEGKKGKDTEMVSSVSSSISMMKAFNQPHKRSFAARKARYGSPKIQARSARDSYRPAVDPHSQEKLSLPLKPSSIENTVGTTASSPIVVITKVTAPITSTMDSSTYYTQLTTSLSNSVYTGVYTQQLQSVSVSYGATQTENAVATSVKSSSATVVPVSDGSSSSNSTGLDAAGIGALVVILVVFFAAGTCYAVVYLNACATCRKDVEGNKPRKHDIELAAEPSAPMTANPLSKN